MKQLLLLAVFSAVAVAAKDYDACYQALEKTRQVVSVLEAARQDAQTALWRSDTLLYAALPGLAQLPMENGTTVTVRTEGRVYALYASDLQGGLRLVTAYELTDLYRDRDAALTRFLALEGEVLAAAALVMALLANRLTRPLAVLTEAGQQIAAGDYARRTALHTGDEIETLSRSFDTMADAVQKNRAGPGAAG
jgi:HAMP domain-containing protein